MLTLSRNRTLIKQISFSRSNMRRHGLVLPICLAGASKLYRYGGGNLSIRSGIQCQRGSLLPSIHSKIRLRTKHPRPDFLQKLQHCRSTHQKCRRTTHCLNHLYIPSPRRHRRRGGNRNDIHGRHHEMERSSIGMGRSGRKYMQQ